MANKAKVKGNAWERDVAKHLSVIFKENFMRVPNSGAYTGGSNIFRLDKLTESQKRMMSGDVIVPPSLSNWKIECKSYKDFEFHHLFTQCLLLNKWLDQVISDNNDVLWFLLVKITRKCKFVVFSESISSKLNIFTYNKIYYKPVNYENSVVIVNYDNFFESNLEEIIKLNAYTHNTIL